MTTETFEAARLIFVLLVIVLRLGLFRRYLQAFLNIAPQKLHYLNRESGKITNLDMQKLVSVFSFFNFLNFNFFWLNRSPKSPRTCALRRFNF